MAKPLPTISPKALPDDLRRARTEARNRFKQLRLAKFDPEATGAKAELKRLSGEFFEFHRGDSLDHAHAGMRNLDDSWGRRRAYFLECRVGEAHVGDTRRAGSRRLVLQVDSLRIIRMLFTDGHYAAGRWFEIADPEKR
jgi:hypothetical protein